MADPKDRLCGLAVFAALRNVSKKISGKPKDLTDADRLAVSRARDRHVQRIEQHRQKATSFADYCRVCIFCRPWRNPLTNQRGGKLRNRQDDCTGMIPPPETQDVPAG
ncbi:hypothetical protein BaRGS_00000426 [Batillaria attramentaria]|uniref:Uncharacterized protein n=1 Tax=Batillaria attramentaria TaxID=370345 RepID=A0ABD0M8X7_9CAEN